MGIQLGIVGYGGMGGFHHRNASKIEGVQVVGAYDIDPVRVQVAEESGLRGFSSLEDLLACEDINTVLVAVPNDCHMEICIAASNAGKHVICAKPAALNVDEFERGRAGSDDCRGWSQRETLHRTSEPPLGQGLPDR